MVSTTTRAAQAPRQTPDPAARRVGRSLHPWAWWAWALSVAVAVSLTTNPLVLLLVALAVVTVILNRRSDAPWARAIRAYFILAVLVLVIRLFFHICIGGGRGDTVLLVLPEVALPNWAQGLRLFGPITAEGLAYVVYDSMRLAVMLLCVGAANALANPRRALRSVPTALYDVAVAVVIALTVAPQLIESTLRVRRARRLRGGSTKGLRAVRAIAIPVLEDAIERSLGLAAGMEARGYGRTFSAGRENRVVTAVLLGAGLSSITFGLFALLGMNVVGNSRVLNLANICLLAGVVFIVAGLRVSGRRLRVTHYRPDHWGVREGLVVASALLAASLVIALSAWQTALLHPSTDPLVWPQLNGWLLLVVALVVVPAFVAPVPPRTRTGR